MSEQRTYRERVFWNHNSYGKAIKISKRLIQIVLLVLAILPIGSSPLFVFIPKVKPIIWRY